MTLKRKNLERILDAARAIVSDEDYIDVYADGQWPTDAEPYINRADRGVYVTARIWVPLDSIRADKGEQT